MSGISGFLSFSGQCAQLLPQGRLEVLKNTLSHRGNTPVAQYQDSDILLISNYFAVASGDPSTGVFCDPATGLYVAIAGRVYNQADLRSRLQGMGHGFANTTQEELILRAFQQWGADFPVRLDGMYGGLVWDSQNRKLWLFRDRIGQRDLFYTITGEGVVFASELKGILPYLTHKPKLNPSVITNVLANQFIYEPLTAYQDIYKLEKASVRWIDMDGHSDRRVYWDIYEQYQAGLDSPETDFEVAKKKLRNMAFEAVERIVLPGEEVGSFLSGGLDSTIVSGILQKISPKPIHTFSIGFARQAFNEADKSQLVAESLGSNHHQKILRYKDVEPLWDEILLNYDEPYADAAAYGEFLCAKTASEYVSCALGGEGGDEFYMGFQLQKDWHSNLLNHRLSYNRNPFATDADVMYLPAAYEAFGNGQLDKLLCHPGGVNYAQSVNARCLYEMGGDLAQRAGLAYVDVYHLVEMIKNDRACQLAGLETRRPLLDRSLVDQSFHLPTRFSIHNGERRYLYKQAFRDLLPDPIYYQQKMGFSLPVVGWLHDYRMDEVKRLFDRELIEDQGIFRYEGLLPYLERFFSGNDNYGFWYLYSVQKWYNDQYMKL